MMKPKPVLLTALVTTTLHVGLCFLFISFFNDQIFGLAAATSLTFFLQFFILTLFCINSAYFKKSFFFPTKETFKFLRLHMKIAIPSTLLYMFDWWCFEILALVAGLISVNLSGAEIILLNCYYLVLTFCRGT